MYKRVFLIVLDSLGAGEAPDAAAYGDEGSSTLDALIGSGFLSCPHLQRAGLFSDVYKRQLRNELNIHNSLLRRI